MDKPFRRPDFKDRHIELRSSDVEVALYVTETGAQKIIELLKNMLEHPQMGHVHLEDYQLLTAESRQGTIALFRAS